MKPIKEMNLLELSDALDTATYAYQNELEELSKRLREIYEQNRWISVSERLPTPEDGKQIHVMDGFGIAFTIMQSQWDSYEPTHWKRLDSPFRP